MPSVQRVLTLFKDNCQYIGEDGKRITPWHQSWKSSDALRSLFTDGELTQALECIASKLNKTLDELPKEQDFTKVQDAFIAAIADAYKNAKIQRFLHGYVQTKNWSYNSNTLFVMSKSIIGKSGARFEQMLLAGLDNIVRNEPGLSEALKPLDDYIKRNNKPFAPEVYSEHMRYTQNGRCDYREKIEHPIGKKIHSTEERIKYAEEKIESYSHTAMANIC